MAGTSSGLHVQYGCGLTAPAGWLNFDASPTLRLQRLPVVGGLLTRGRVRFPNEVHYGDITRGLPVVDGACAGVFASHVLEHLPGEDVDVALKETLRILRPGGVFRMIVPDLKVLAEQYIDRVRQGDASASSVFMRDGYFGVESRPRGLLKRVEAMLGNSAHLWMWDEVSMSDALARAGFTSIRPAKFGDAEDPAFAAVEAEDRFVAAVALEARK